MSVPPGPPSSGPSSRPSSTTSSALSSAPTIRSRASGPTSGQTSTPSASPGPTPSSDAAVRRASRTSSCRASSPTSTATEPARQRWPPAPNDELMIAGIEVPRSASGMTTSEFFAPPRAWTRLPVAAERSATMRAVVAWPTNEIALMSGVVEDRRDRVARAVDEVHDARGNLVDVCDQLDDPLGRARVALGRLQDEGVAARDGVGQEPQRDHRREVERRDRGADADGLAHELDVHSGRDPFEVLALEEVRDAASRLGRTRSRGAPRPARRRASCPCPR